MASDRTCSVPDCHGPVRAKGFCEFHYQRQRRGKDLYAPRYGYTPWGQLVEAAVDLADATEGRAYHHAMEKFRDAVMRVFVCGEDEIRKGWRKVNKRGRAA